MELFDVLNCRGERTGAVIARDEAHRTGTWHGAFHCCITGKRDGRWYVLLQKRAAAKQIAPSLLDVSVGGHYAAGEDARAAGPREIREELGLVVPFSDLVPLGRRVFVYCFTPGMQEYEFQDVFLLHRDLEPADLTLQAEELDGAVLLDGEAGIELLSGRMRSLATVLYRPDGGTAPVEISAADFVPTLDNYYVKLLLLARRFHRGDNGPLLI